MSEGELIEIAQRFRKLEDAVEAAAMNWGCNPFEKALEACRDDMVAMQELIRGKA